MAYNTHTPDRVEQYFHICEVPGQRSDSDDKLCIVIEFSRYRLADGQLVNSSVRWHGPFESPDEASALIGPKQPSPTASAAPTADQKVGKVLTNSSTLS